MFQLIRRWKIVSVTIIGGRQYSSGWAGGVGVPLIKYEVSNQQFISQHKIKI